MAQNIIKIDQESYRLLVESVKDYAIIMLDEEGYIISWNKGAKEINKYEADEIIGKHISVFYTPEDIYNGEPAINLQWTKKLGRLEKEGWRIRKDGSRFWANVVYTVLKDADGKFVGFGKVTRDMTKKRKTDELIQRLNEELQGELEKSKSEILDYKHALDESSIVAITDQKGMITHVNNNFCKISKYSEEELLGQDHRIINSGYHSSDFIRNLWVTIANGKIWRGELKNRAKDGSIYWVDTTIVPFLNAKGKPYQYLAIRSDITQRKIAEEEIIRINEDLERKIKERTLELTNALEREKELSEMKSRFVSMASHEFRTPLSAILSSVSLVDHYKAEEHDEKRIKHIERIKSSVRNLTEILDGFLSIDKLEQGRVEVKCDRFQLDEFVEDVIEEMEGALKKKKQYIEYVFKGIMEIQQDKKILRNVLLNLLSNASKYSPEEKTIYVLIDAGEKMVSASVRDEGFGIPMEAQKDLFGKFFRANNAVNIQGTGLGLNIVQKYVELLEGTIEFTSKENEGSTFTITFPRSLG